MKKILRTTFLLERISLKKFDVFELREKNEKSIDLTRIKAIWKVALIHVNLIRERTSDILILLSLYIHSIMREYCFRENFQILVISRNIHSIGVFGKPK